MIQRDSHIPIANFPQGDILPNCSTVQSQGIGKDSVQVQSTAITPGPLLVSFDSHTHLAPPLD